MAKPPPDVGEQNWRRIKATVKPLKKASTSPLAGEDSEGCQLAGYRSLERGAAQSNLSANRPPLQDLLGGKAAKLSLSSPARGEVLNVTPDLIRGRARPDTLPTAPGQGPGNDLHKSSPLAKDWERTLRTGRATPDMVIDLHGHNLAGAHSQLARALDRAAASGARIILVIAGKSRGPDEAPRGAIRRELATWLAHSHHAGRILAVRNAHPRHGGAGAVYVVLRKG